MKQYRVHPKDPLFGMFTDLFIIGTTRGAAGVSDFTDGDNAQSFTLGTPAAGDQVTYPCAAAFTKVAFAGDSVSAVALDVGFGAAGEEFIKDAAMVAITGSGAAHTVDSAATAAGAKVFDGSTLMTATFTKTGGTTVALLTAGEVWIYVSWLRKAELCDKNYA